MAKIKLIIKVGQRFGRLILQRELTKEERGNYRGRVCLFKCDCGKEKVIPYWNVASSRTSSCKCFVKKRSGLSESQLGRVWQSMNNRCYNPKNTAFKNYGGRGITVCDEWRTDIISFCNWCKDNGHKTGLELDRIDNSKGYSPDNCRFVTPSDNSRNKRNTVWVDHNGTSMVLKDYAIMRGVCYKKLHSRITYYGHTPESAVESILYYFRGKLKKQHEQHQRS